MIEYSSLDESNVLKGSAYAAFGLSALPLLYASSGKVGFESASVASLIFIVIGVAALFFRRRNHMDLKLLDKYMEISYPIRGLVIKIDYSEIESTDFSDLSFSVTIKLKNGQKISLSSSLKKIAGEFSRDYFDPSAIQGAPGDRLKLKNEIEFRRKAREIPASIS